MKRYTYSVAYYYVTRMAPGCPRTERRVNVGADHWQEFCREWAAFAARVPADCTLAPYQPEITEIVRHEIPNV